MDDGLDAAFTEGLRTVARLMAAVDDNPGAFAAAVEIISTSEHAAALWALLDLRDAFGTRFTERAVFQLEAALERLGPLLEMPFAERERLLRHGEAEVNEPSLVLLHHLERRTWNQDSAAQLELAETAVAMARRLAESQGQPLIIGAQGELSREQALYGLSLGRLLNAYCARGDLAAARDNARNALMLQDFYLPGCPDLIAAELAWLLGRFYGELENWASGRSG